MFYLIVILKLIYYIVKVSPNFATFLGDFIYDEDDNMGVKQGLWKCWFSCKTRSKRDGEDSKNEVVSKHLS